MAPKDPPEPADPGDVLRLLKGIADDATSAYSSFKKKLASGALSDPLALAAEMSDLFSITADVAQYAFQAHFEHFEWASAVDEDLDELKEGEIATTILPEDAVKLKSVILALAQNLRPSTGPDDESILAAIKQEAEEAVKFIDESTAEEEEESEEDDDADASNAH